MASQSAKPKQYGNLPAWKLKFFEAGILVKMPEFDAYYISAEWLYHAAQEPDPVQVEWSRVRNSVLRTWIAEHPGTRPYAWWCFDAPGVRERVGGTGTPKHEVLKYAPVYDFGIPKYWITQQDITLRRKAGFKGKPLDKNNPPLYESQAAFLQRHGLLSEEEMEILPADAYDLEVIVR